MKEQPVFFNIYRNLSAARLLVIIILLCVGGGVLYYFNLLGNALEEREKAYATLYAESVRFFIEQSLDSPCDYTFVSEVVTANETIPTILVTGGVPVQYSNVPELADSSKLAKMTAEEIEDLKYLKIAEMSEEHPPIEINMGGDKAYLYYSSSLVLQRLRFFPYILIGTFLIFGSLAFIAYNSSRRAEQNRVWVGLAKETAHQLGTPISGLLGWIEVLRSGAQFDESIGKEMEKDVNRLEIITNRFSNIGSVPNKSSENIEELVFSAARYLENRISTKIEWKLSSSLEEPVFREVNKNLIEWVIENLSKNAVDAMEGVGTLSIHVSKSSANRVIIDVSDTGKGLSKRNQNKIFNPGYSTKKRGWGLGLTLAKRIIETYHSGKLFVLKSEVGVGTTFRLIV